MTTEHIEVSIGCGYGGHKAIINVHRSKSNATALNIETFIMEIEDVKNLLEKMIEEKGYTLSKSNRQKYQRLTINL